MTTTLLSPVAVQKFFDNNGIPLVGGQLYSYAAGTSTPQATYADQTGVTANSNPIILNSRGECGLWLTQGQAYKLVLMDASSNIIWTADQVTAPAASNYLPVSTGAVSRSLASKLGDWVSVKDFGAKGDGATNDVSAFQSAINWVNSLGGGAVFCPQGNYILGSSITMKQKVRVYGDGIDTTILKPSFAGNVFAIDLTAQTPYPGFPDASVYWDNFTIDCGAQTGVTGISMTVCRTSSIRSIKFKGCVNNVFIDRGRTHSLSNLYSEGTSTLKMGGYTLTDTTNADHVFESHLTDIHFFNNYTTGTQAQLVYFRRGALLTLSNFTLNDGVQGNTTGAIGMLLENDCQGCKISNGVMSAVSIGVLMQAGTGPSNSPIYCEVNSVDIDQATNASIIIDNGGFNTVMGCKCSSSAVSTSITSIIARNGTGSNILIGNNVSDYNGASGTALDITNSSGNIIEGNVFSNCTNGITIGAASSTSQTIHGNLFRSIANAIIGAPGQAGNSIKNNTGWKQTINLAPAVPGSTVATTNNTGYAVTVYVAGGTYTVISVNSIFTALQSNTGGSGGVRLEPGDAIAITYSATPSWVWIPSWG